MKNPNFLKAMQAAMKGKERVDQAAARALKAMNVPTRTEFRRAVARIDALEEQLTALKAAKTPAAPKARRKAKGARSARQA
jgi:polyhydroxyalkanoate synthesis regulator phasin